MRLLQRASSQAAREYIRVAHFAGVVFCYCYFSIVHHFLNSLYILSHMVVTHLVTRSAFSQNNYTFILKPPPVVVSPLAASTYGDFCPRRFHANCSPGVHPARLGKPHKNTTGKERKSTKHSRLYLIFCSYHIIHPL